MRDDVATVDEDVSVAVPSAVADAVPEEDAEPRVRSARAAVAMLSLQLRAAEHDAVDAEAVDPTIRFVAARAQLRDRLEHLIQHRRRELAAELEAAEAKAEQTVRAARAEASALVAAAEAEHRERMAILAARPIPPVPVPGTAVEPVAAPAAAPLDTAALSQAVAVAVAVALADRFPPQANGARPPGAALQREKESWLSILTHVDVLLPLMAAVIVLVILVAWVG
jgi:hypothetical protein